LENQAIEFARRKGLPLYVCEGELDALSFWQMGRPALATYGANRWPNGWCASWADLSRVVVVADQDGARRTGEKLAERIGAAAVRELGLNETARILRGATVNKSSGLKDPNDLLRAGKLGAFINLCEAMP
jgi:DNA primase